ncbi:MAG: hypothetical protein K2I96_10240, partial [Lachnospiraceae bacterium]|nr:hypothetical protein [Lachnospiraceae bacterium]
GSYDAQNYSEESYNTGSYDAQNYSEESYDTGSYDAQNYSEENYNTGSYDVQNYTEESYDTQSYGAVNYNEQSYGNSGYGVENDPNGQYRNENFNQQNYAGGQYAEEDYNQGNYSNEQYAAEGYGQETYPSGQNNFVDDGYGNLSYVDGSYQDNGYTSEFYVEQAYDENGNLISPELYADSDYAQDSYDYPQGESMQDNSYAEQAGAPKEYRNGLHLVQNTAPPAGNASDMSQYNTINLQKVVAESMKELFPDDNDDVFAEDREKYNSGAVISNTAGDTRIFAGITDLDAAKKKTGGSMDSQTQTGRVKISQMVTGVLEKAPEPHTGAIKKVLVPGDDARSIKSDSNIEELRDTTERSVDEEHNRMEDNDENVYHEQRIMAANETEEAPQAQTTGPMKLDEVLVEWERMKQNNAKKHQEEIKKRVLTQTGKIFADFDHSIRSGILGELEREEKEAERSSEKAGSISRQGNVVTMAQKSKDGFLDADVTGDIPRQSVSEDDFEIEYVADQKQPPESQVSAESGNLTKGIESDQHKERESDVEEEEFMELEQAAAQEPDTATDEAFREETYAGQKAEEETGKYAQGMTTEQMGPYESDERLGEAEQETTENYEAGGDAETVYDANAGYEAADANIVRAEDNTYTQKICTEGVDEYDAENAPYIGEIFAQDNDGYTVEAYPENTSGYTGEAYPESVGQHNEESYAQDAGEYTAQLYSDGVGEYTAELYGEDTGEYTGEVYGEDTDEYTGEAYAENASGYTQELYAEERDRYTKEIFVGETGAPYMDKSAYADASYMDDAYDDLEDAYSDTPDNSRNIERRQNDRYNENGLDPEDAESIAEMAKEDALRTQEIKMNTADLSSLSEKIVATTKKEASGAKREEIRDFTPEEQTLFENFAVTKKIKKQIIYALENMTLAAYTGNVIITGDAGLDTVRMAKNLIKEYQASDEGFSGKLAKITGEKINQRNIKDVFEKLNNGGIIIEKANGMSEEKLYELATNLNQDTLGIVVIMEDTKKEITKLLEKQAMIVDYFNIRIDLMEMDNNALVAYAKNYALALEYSIDELGTLALYTRIANMQSGNHVVTKDEVRDIIDEAIWKSKKSKLKNFVDVLFARRYDNEDMIVLKERDFM